MDAVTGAIGVIKSINAIGAIESINAMIIASFVGFINVLCFSFWVAVLVLGQLINVISFLHSSLKYFFVSLEILSC